MVVLSTVGSRSKKLRKTPVMRLEHGGCYAAVASLAERHTTPPGTTTCWHTLWRNSRTAPWSRV
ncbi:nitroreductase/quinone reductase family protein [Streptomyces sp. NPDC054962]